MISPLAAAERPAGGGIVAAQCFQYHEPAWREVACTPGSGYTLRWSGSKADFKATCEKQVTLKTAYWDYATAGCLAIGGIGYFLQYNDGAFRCCGQTPIGTTTCQNNLMCPTGFSADQNAGTAGKTCRRQSTKTEIVGDYVTPGLTRAPYTNEPAPITTANCGPAELDSVYWVTVPPEQPVRSANPQWHRPKCDRDFTILSRTQGNSVQVTCESRETTRSAQWLYTQATCPNLGGIGHFLTFNDGAFRCCGNGPLGKTCQNILQCPKGYQADPNASTPARTCRSKVLATTTDVIYSYPRGWE